MGVPVIASAENGTTFAVWVDVPKSAFTAEWEIWARAKEEHKTISDFESGKPNTVVVEEVLVWLEPLDIIFVDFGTDIDDAIAKFPAYVDGVIGYKITGFSGIFVPDNAPPTPLPVNKAAWATKTGAEYDGDVSALYHFYAAPDLTDFPNLQDPNNVVARQPVYVLPEDLEDNQFAVTFINGDNQVYQQIRTLNETVYKPDIEVQPPDNHEFVEWKLWCTDTNELIPFNFDDDDDPTPVTRHKLLFAVHNEIPSDQEWTVSGTLSGGTVNGLKVTWTIDGEPGEYIVGADGEYEITEIPHGALLIITPPTQTGFTISQSKFESEIRRDWENVDFIYTRIPTETIRVPGGGGTVVIREPGETVIIDNPPPLAGPGLERTLHFRYIFGYEDGTIRPDRQVTREEVATIFFRLLNVNSRIRYRTNMHTFPDVALERWSNQQIATMQNAGIVQ